MDKSKVSERIEKKHELQEDIKALLQENSTTSVRVSTLRNKMISEREAYSSLKNTVENDHQRGRERSSYEGMYEESKRNLQQMSEQLTTLEKRQLEIQEEIEAKKEELRACDTGASAEEVLTHLSEIESLKSEKEQIISSIEEQQSIISSLDDGDDEKLEGLQSQKEELLADIALGSDRQSELNVINQAIDDILNDKDGQHTEAVHKEVSAKQTITGLNKRLDNLNVKIEVLESKTPAYVEQFLIGQAEQASEKYIQLAKGLIEELMRIKTISDLLEKTTNPPKRLLMYSFDDVLIPAFSTNAFSEIDAHDESQGILFASRIAGYGSADRDSEYQAYRKQLISEFNALGLQSIF
jgi:chromosome segregation ATPase